MPARRLRYLILLAGAVGSLPEGALAAEESITLRVPVQLKSMMQNRFKLTCRIMAANAVVGVANTDREIVNGTFDGTIELVITPSHTNRVHWPNADRYRCFIYVGLGSIPRRGTSLPGFPKEQLGRPDEFFRVDMTYPLGSGKAVDGLASPGDLAIPPKQKQ